MAIGRTPDAKGSRVPPWPTFLIFKIFDTLVTANREEIPIGLSSITQPLVFLWINNLLYPKVNNFSFL